MHDESQWARRRSPFIQQDASLGNGYRVLKTPSLNKGLGFTSAERQAMGLKGLLPPATLTLVSDFLISKEILEYSSLDMSYNRDL